MRRGQPVTRITRPQTRAIAFHGLKRASLKSRPSLKSLLAAVWVALVMVLSPLLPNGVAKNENNFG